MILVEKQDTLDESLVWRRLRSFVVRSSLTDLRERSARVAYKI
jgi:hypothetical protein